MSVFAQPDILRAAQSMIRDHGSRAAEKAAEEVSKANLQKRSTAAEAWQQIEHEISRLQAESSPDS